MVAFFLSDAVILSMASVSPVRRARSQAAVDRDDERLAALPLYERPTIVRDDPLMQYCVDSSDRPWLARLGGEVGDSSSPRGKRMIHEARRRFSALRRGGYTQSKAFDDVRGGLREAGPGELPAGWHRG